MYYMYITLHSKSNSEERLVLRVLARWNLELKAWHGKADKKAECYLQTIKGQIFSRNNKYRVSQKKVDSNKYLLIFCRTCDIFEILHVGSRHHGMPENQDSDHLGCAAT